MIAGIFSSAARSSVRVIFSPATEPIEPPMKPKSAMATATDKPSICALPAVIESYLPVFCSEARSLSI